MKKLMIGICTYNRKKLIEYTSRSLGEVVGIQNTCVRIFDDCSTEYDKKYLNETSDVRIVIDYIAGMTDEFFEYQYDKISRRKSW